jgi:iron complex outermembrane recepter protein
MNTKPELRGATGVLRPVSVGVLHALILGGLSLSTAFAQTAPAPAPAAPAAENVVKLDTFVTTGSRFRDRTVTESPVPIDVISGVELKQGGYTETNQMLQAAVPSFNFPRASVADGTDHIRPATLRGLAPDQTLVLLNGKRRHTSSLVNVNGTVGRGAVSVDLNTIPASMIERIEVLRDGASAQYGSDAIAGVINVILRKDTGYGFEGLWGVTKEGDGEVRDASVWAGIGLEGGGSLFVDLYYRDRQNTNRSKPDTRQQYFGTNTSGAPTAISGAHGSGVHAPPAGVTFDPREATINRLNHRHGDGDSEDRGIFLNASLPMSWEGGELYAFGGYNTRDGQAAGFFRRPGDNRTVRALYPNGFLPLINSDVTDFSFGTGVRGRGQRIDWDLSTVYGANDFDFTITNSANVTLGAQSPTRFYAGTLGFDQWTTNLDFTTTIDAGRAIKTAFGLEYRWEEYSISPGEPDSYRDGGVRILDGPAAGSLGAVGAQVFPGFRPSDAIKADRTSYAAYVDFETKLGDQWLASLAGRFEDYSDFGSTFDVKLASRFEISSAAAVRGSVSTGFRAPHLAQQWFSSTATNFIGGVPFEQKTFPVSDPVARLLGASPLTPEESVNYSIGLTLQPVEALTMSVDYYNITLDDRVVLSSNFTGTAVQNFLIANGQPQASGGRYFTNAVDTRTSGVDVNARYTLRTDDLGRWTFTLGANFNETTVRRVKPTPTQLAGLGITTPIFDLTELVRMEEGTPKNVVNFNTNWSYKRFTVNLRNIRYGEVSLVANTSVNQATVDALRASGARIRTAPTVPAGANFQVIQDFSAKWITDLEVAYRHDKRWSLAAGINNVLDIYPDRNVNVNDNAGIFAYNGISPWGFNGRFYYTRASLRF